jgi:hypothetical protein
MGMKSAALWFGEHALLAIIISGAGMILLLVATCWHYGSTVRVAVLVAASWQLWLASMLYRHGEDWGLEYFLRSHWSVAIVCAGFPLNSVLN